MGATGPTWWFIDEAKTAAVRDSCAGEPEWLAEAEVVEDEVLADEEEEEEDAKTLPGVRPQVAPVAAIAPRRQRGGRLLPATLLVSSVALTFLVGWWSGSRQAPPSAPAQANAAATAARMDAPRATRILAPPSETTTPEPEPQAEPVKPEPKLFAIPMPRPAAAAAPAAPAASVYVPMDL